MLFHASPFLIEEIHTWRRGDIMSFNKFIRVSEQPPKADKSALAAINRALQSIAGLFL